jgi:hypothetical protein
MIGSLTRIATDLGNYVESGAPLGEASTQLQVRKPFFNHTTDPRIAPSIHAGEQIDAFRGTIYAAVDKIARRVCQVPLRLWQCEHDITLNEYEEFEIKFHPFLSLFSSTNGRKPHEEYSVWEFIYAHTVSLDTTGESWWLVERDKLGRPARTTPLPANRMTVVIEQGNRPYLWSLLCPKGTTPESGGIFIPKRSWKELTIIRPSHSSRSSAIRARRELKTRVVGRRSRQQRTPTTSTCSNPSISVTSCNRVRSLAVSCNRSCAIEGSDRRIPGAVQDSSFWHEQGWSADGAAEDAQVDDHRADAARPAVGRGDEAYRGPDSPDVRYLGRKARSC